MLYTDYIPMSYSHIYHYYLHGPNGNMEGLDENSRAPTPFKNIDIQVRWKVKFTKTNN